MARRQICAETVVARRPDLMALVMALHWRGLVLSPHARVIRRRDGSATIRLVWRNRGAGEAITLTIVDAEEGAVVAYNFQARFAAAIESGAKTTTFRARGKRRHARPGDMLQLYTGMRSKGCRLLRTVQCRAAVPLVIDGLGMVLGGSPMSAGEADALARRDGFASGQDMIQWVEDTHGLPVEGWLIEWGEPWIGPAGSTP